MTDMQRQIESIHRQMKKTSEADHVVIATPGGTLHAFPVHWFVGTYRNPALLDLEADVLEVVKGG